MNIPNKLPDLIELFRRLGAPDPEAWAKSQTDEGIQQLHRYLFLRQAWSAVVSEQDKAWIEQSLAATRQDPDAPFAGVGRALANLLATGARREDLVDLVRGMQVQTMYRICYLLGDPSFDEPELDDLGWSLVVESDDEQATRQYIGGLHESVLETDPTGREMRPRKAD